jgi:hypothetical protein
MLREIGIEVREEEEEKDETLATVFTTVFTTVPKYREWIELSEGSDQCWGMQMDNGSFLAYNYEQLCTVQPTMPYPYKRVTYFKTLLSQLQALYRCNTPKNIPPLQRRDMYGGMRKWCKKNKRSDLYAYIPRLILLAGGPQITFTPHQYQQLIKHFMVLEHCFKKCNETRKYFIHYYTIITTLCQHLNIHLPYPLPIVHHPQRHQHIKQLLTLVLHEFTLYL